MKTEFVWYRAYLNLKLKGHRSFNSTDAPHSMLIYVILVAGYRKRRFVFIRIRLYITGCAGGGSTSFASDDPGAGGGSWARVPTSTCSLAPNFDTVPSNPGTTHDDFGSLNGSVEVWIFADGC